MILKEKTLMRVDAPNRNMRQYPREVVEAALATKTTMYGLLGEPAIVGDDEGTFKIDVPTAENAAFVASNFKFDGDYVVCDVETLDTHTGRIFEQLTTLPKGCGFYPVLTVGGYIGSTMSDGVQLVTEWDFIVPYATVIPMWD